MNIRQSMLEKIGSIKIGKEKQAKKVSQYFGVNTFSVKEMKKRVSKKTLDAFARWQEEGVTITAKEADEIASAMKEWAVHKGAAFYAHWFQPMTGLTAEKHDTFISLKKGEAVE